MHFTLKFKVSVCRLRDEASPEGELKRQTILTITFCSAIWRNFLIETCYTN